ncbi:MAG: DUF982 domain-containing protein [Chelatococcus sp.]|nr:DUF982 domain-containing protein [Chelatococcus sp. YT9]MBX3559228.1 DUF982 domain-containing protein [Chelatococcus sp.]
MRLPDNSIRFVMCVEDAQAMLRDEWPVISFTRTLAIDRCGLAPHPPIKLNIARARAAFLKAAEEAGML